MTSPPPRPFLIWPDPRLRRPADPVAGVDAEVLALWDEMLRAMYAMPGVGLAAPQIGVGLRLAVIDCSTGARAPVRLANPEFVWQSEKTETHPEGSPNLPGLTAPVTRPAEIGLRFLDESGAVVERVFAGLWAASAQHQLEHLDGRLFVERLGPVKRRLLLSRHAKRQRRG